MGDKYLLDANVFITAHRKFYPFDIVPSFWRQLVEKAADKIIIIEEIDNELLRGQDVLVEWYKENRDKFQILRIPDQSVIVASRRIMNYISENEQFTESAKIEFASSADLWLCAHGLAFGGKIVTLETYESEIKKRVKVPNVCVEFGIEYMDLLQFMRAMDFVL